MSAAAEPYLPPSGQQYEIRHDTQHAVVTEVGATLRHYAVDGSPIIDGFEVDDMASGGHGQVLAPWPNRLGNGRYTFEGQAERVPLNEPERANAIHGLVRWLQWTCVSHSSSAVRMRCVLEPQPAYQWRLALEIEYSLGSTGLSVSTTATNLSPTRAPFGIGFHPYLTIGTPTVDDAVLSVPGRRRLLTDDQGLPVRRCVGGRNGRTTSSRPAVSGPPCWTPRSPTSSPATTVGRLRCFGPRTADAARRCGWTPTSVT